MLYQVKKDGEPSFLNLIFNFELVKYQSKDNKQCCAECALDHIADYACRRGNKIAVYDALVKIISADTEYPCRDKS